MLIYGTALFNGDGVTQRPGARLCLCQPRRGAGPGAGQGRRWPRWTSCCPLEQRAEGRRAAQIAKAKAVRQAGAAKPGEAEPPKPAEAAAKPRQAARQARRRAGACRAAARRLADPARRLLQRASAEACSASCRPAALGGRAGHSMSPRARSPGCRSGRSKAAPRQRRLRRAPRARPASRSRRNRLRPRPSPAAGSLDPQQGIEAVVVEPGVGDFGQRGLGAIGDPEPRFLDHQPVVGAVADREHIGRLAGRARRAPRSARRAWPRHRRSGPSTSPLSWRVGDTRRLARTRSNPTSCATGSAKDRNPPDTSRQLAPPTRIVRTRVAAPGLGRTRSARHWRIASSSSPASSATRSRKRALEIELALHRPLGDRRRSRA